MFRATILLWTVCYIAQAFFDWRPMQLIVLNQAKLMQGILHNTTELDYFFLFIWPDGLPSIIL